MVSRYAVIAFWSLCLLKACQAIIFILKREFMLVGWLAVYILSYVIFLDIRNSF